MIFKVYRVKLGQKELRLKVGKEGEIKPMFINIYYMLCYALI